MEQLEDLKINRGKRKECRERGFDIAIRLFVHPQSPRGVVAQNRARGVVVAVVAGRKATPFFSVGRTRLCAASCETCFTLTLPLASPPLLLTLVVPDSQILSDSINQASTPAVILYLTLKEPWRPYPLFCARL